LIELINKTAKAIVHPWRGASMSHWEINGRNILYCDNTSFSKPEVKYNGGIPIMFPTFSTTCIDGSSSIHYNGKKIDLPQHGLARLSRNWRANQIEENKVILYLQSSEESLKSYPYDFEFELEYTLNENSLEIKQSIFNPSNETLPFVAGIHPYFAIDDLNSCEVNGIPYGTPYELVLNTGKKDFNAKLKDHFPFGKEETNHHFRYTGNSVTLKDRSKGYSIKLEKSPEYPCLSVWSEPDQPFICLEPNSGRRGAFENRNDLIRINKGEKWSGSICISKI
jgi:galactose mutarotase-like enzyme